MRIKTKVRIFLLGALMICAQNIKAQSFYNNQLYVFNLGYGSTNTTFKAADVPNQKISVGHAPLTYEYFSRNAYFYSDVLTPMIDLCLGAFNQQYWWGHERDGFIYSGGDWPLARLALGGYIGDKLGIYAGGQWGYSRWKMAPGKYVNDKREYTINSETELGGHTFGPGVHTVLDFNKILIRNSFMYDFVTDGFKGKRYTNSFTWDVMAMYGLTNDNMIGVFANYVYAPSRSDVQLTKLRFGLSIAFDR